MSGRVSDILQRIKELPEAEFLELQSELARLEEQEWATLAADARRDAKARGIDDDTIVRTIESDRYGDRSQ